MYRKLFYSNNAFTTLQSLDETRSVTAAKDREISLALSEVE